MAPTSASPSAPSGGSVQGSALWGWVLWGVVLALAVVGRQLLPIDETRYAAVAWEMWRDQHWAYPTLDGAFYAQKPPLLFWLTLLGWSMAGVADWVPRAIVALMTLGTMVLTARLAKRLWPHIGVERWVPLTFGLGLVWLLFAPAWYFDIPNALWCVAGFHGLLDLAARRWGRGALWLTLAAIGGVFTKGPMVLLTVGAAAVWAPVWGPAWHGWRAPRVGLAAAVVAVTMAAGVAAYAGWLAWASALAGEPVWRDVLGAQAIERLSDEADHASPWWWYLPQLLWMLWPGWVVALALWPRPPRAGLAQADAGARLTWLTGALLLLVLSLAAGKRAHYAMGWMPLGAAWLAHRLSQADLRRPVSWGWRALAALPALAAGLALVVAPGHERLSGLYPWAGPRLQVVGAALALWALAMAWPARDAVRWVQRLAAGGVLLVLLHVALPWAMGPSFQLRALAERIGQAMRAGQPVAWADGRFHGVLTFYGRLPQSPQPIDDSQVRPWLERHPDGLVLRRVKTNLPGGDCAPYRSSWLCLETAQSAQRTAMPPE